MANTIYGIIKIESVEDRCYFRVSGDYYEYGDLDSVVRMHPELADKVEENRIELQRALYRQKELLGFV